MVRTVPDGCARSAENGGASCRTGDCFESRYRTLARPGPAIPGDEHSQLRRDEKRQDGAPAAGACGSPTDGGMADGVIRGQAPIQEREFEIGRILHLKSEIGRSQIGLTAAGRTSNLRSSNLGFEMQDSSNFKFL